MAKTDNLPFQRGTTYFDKRGSETVSSTEVTGSNHILGQEYTVRDDQHSTGRTVTLRVVRNTSGVAILPKYLARLNALGTEILGYTRLPEEKGFPVDELLPSGGCFDDDICYVVVEGPALCKTSVSNYSADVAARALLNSQTAAASTHSTTAGRVDVRAVAAATADATAGQRNVTEQDGVFGAAVSSALTSATDSDILVDVANRVHA